MEEFWWQIFFYLFLLIGFIGIIVMLNHRGDDRLDYLLTSVILPLVVSLLSFCCWMRLKFPKFMTYAPVIFGVFVIGVCVLLKSIYLPNSMIKKAEAEIAKQNVTGSLGHAILIHYHNKPLPTTQEAPESLKKWGYKRVSPEEFILSLPFHTPRNLRMRLMKTFEEPNYWIENGNRAVFYFEKRKTHSHINKDMKKKS